MAVAKRRVLPPEERKQEILTAAREIFSAKGYRAAAVSDILELAGIARGTFYHYFNSKKDVFLELVESYFADFDLVLQECHKRLMENFEAGASPLETWKEYALEVFRFHSRNPKLTLLVYREAMALDEHFSYRVDELSDMGTKYIANDLRVMQERGLIGKCDVEIAATIITGATVFLTLEYVVRRGADDLETLAEELAVNQIKALAPLDVIFNQLFRTESSS